MMMTCPACSKDALVSEPVFNAASEANEALGNQDICDVCGFWRAPGEATETALARFSAPTAPVLAPQPATSKAQLAARKKAVSKLAALGLTSEDVAALFGF